MKLAVSVLLATLVCVALAESAAPRTRKFVSPLSKAAFNPSALDDPRVPPFTTYWYEQTLDHFNFVNDGTWKQRYLVVGA